MNLPTRIGLQVIGSGGNPACSFTVFFRYVFTPSKGDRILLQIPRQGQTGIAVAEVFHFVPVEEDEPACLILTAPIVVDSYDNMLEILDWFKATYAIEGIQADAEPELYYKFYRNLVHILGLTKVAAPLVEYDAVSIKVFAEACRVVLLAELKPSPDETEAALVNFNPAVRHLHELVLGRRVEEPDGASMLAVVKAWEFLINPKKSMQWLATVEDCFSYIKVVFDRLRSIPADKLPPILRIE